VERPPFQAERRPRLKEPRRRWSPAANWDSDWAARWVTATPEVVFSVTEATAEMLRAISVLPPAASARLRPISLVVVVCSSTALAMVCWYSWIWAMMVWIWPMASTAPCVPRWMASMRWPISSVAPAVCLASSLTSLATTAKPLPASPARAASMVAFRASRLVCWAMEVISLMTLPISAPDSPRRDTVWSVARATSTPREATRAASWAFLAISRMLAPISSTPADTVWMLALTCSAAVAAAPA
jgi:hypothetical protein